MLHLIKVGNTSTIRKTIATYLCQKYDSTVYVESILFYNYGLMYKIHS